MQIIQDKASLQAFVVKQRQEGKSIGFVPTMGALHQGHLSLIEACRAENEIVICSIYVNPTQFDNKTDLAKYPKNLHSDATLLVDASVDILFAPEDDEMYPEGLETISSTISFGKLESVMEGKHRKGHFAGVGLVVSKLFHIVKPDRAYFGQKDLQQYAVIRQMVADFSFGIELKRCPIVRETDGLAMSSRNVRLTERERFVASKLHETLQSAKNMLQEGKSLNEIKDTAIANICKHKDFKIEYFEIVDLKTLQSLSEMQKEPMAICVAAYLGQVRLIDNIIAEEFN